MNLKKFVDWFETTNVNRENVFVQHSKQIGFGLYSTKTFLDKDILLLSIPQQLFVKPTFQNENLTGFEHLIAFLLENPTDPYVEFLKSIETIPQWRRFEHENYPKQLFNQMKIHLHKYNFSRQKFVQFDDEIFQWAFYSVNTRCVHFDMQILSKDSDDNLCLIPFLG